MRGAGRSAPRRRSREAALQVLYALDLAARGSGVPPTPAAAEEALENAAAHLELPPSAREFARELVHGVVAHRDKLDALVARHATHWRLDRMAAVDRNVLRLAAYETLYTSTPAAVVIDEAVRLAHRFASDESPGFVNGVLDALARAVRGDAG